MKNKERPRYSYRLLEQTAVATPTDIPEENVRQSWTRLARRPRLAAVKLGKVVSESSPSSATDYLPIYTDEGTQRFPAKKALVSSFNSVFIPAPHASTHASGGTDPLNVTTLTGLPLPIANGGTANTTATAAFNALDPLTTKGDLIAHNGTDSMRVAVGASGFVLTADSTASTGVAWLAAAAGSGGTTHDILSATHTDTLASAVVRGDIIRVNSTPAWARLAVGASARVLRSDGVDPSWAQVAAATDITGTLAIGNGGTGATTATAAFNALDPLTTKGDLIAHDGTDSVRVAVGANATVLTADSGSVAGVKWSAIPTQQSALLDGGTVHTDTANRAPVRGAIIYAESTPVWSRLAIGTAGQMLGNDGTDVAWQKNYGTTVYVPTTGDTAINSVTDVTIATRDVASVSAGDQVIIEGEFIILNNSGAGRVYNITADFDAAFDCEWVTGSLAASATLMHAMSFRAVCTIRSTILAYCVNKLHGGPVAGIAGGGDPTMLATDLTCITWGTTTNDLTGTLTCVLKIRSANATATQTCRLVNFEVRRLTPGTPSGA